MSYEITSVTANSRTTAASEAQSAQKNELMPGLGQDAFMKLLLAQMQSQDPLSPTDNQDFFTQLAQMSMLEQMGKMNDTLGSMMEQQQFLQAGSFIGRTIEAIRVDNTLTTGVVDGVRVRNGETFLEVDDEEIPLSCVTSVHQQPPEE